MGIRRKAREKALQFLFQHDLNPPENLAEALNHFWVSQSTGAIQNEGGKAKWNEVTELPPLSTEEASIRVFADPLIEGAITYRDTADEEIVKHADNWKLSRIAAVDRNVLRLAIYELRNRDDIPPVVSINEAIDLAKKFSTDDSGKFVNGILDRVRADLIRPARTPAE